jgi:DNA-binding IclR family transcriptional regulator
LWRLIRAKHRFTKDALVISSGLKPATVDHYVRQLEKGGYVKKTGRDGRLVTYMLVKVNQVKRPGGMDQGGVK